MNKAVLLTSIPSPYIVELIDAVNALGRWRIFPLYERYTSVGRHWRISSLKHEHIVMERSAAIEIEKSISTVDLVVIGTLWGRNCATVLQYQKKYSKPFVFWGEKPGAVWRNIAATMVRRLLISRRFRQARAVWGIGKWAIEEYKKCLSTTKIFENMPYASDIKPYLNIVRNEGDTTQKPIRILFSGSLIYRKGVDLLISAILRLLSDGNNISLTMMGHGELEEKLKNMIPQKYYDQIRFIGFKEWYELPGIYAVHDLLVVPSRYDGWGLVVVEGLAAGVPVIATNMMGSAIDFIKHGENGWMITAGDSESLCATLKEALSAPLLEMGRNARKSVECWTLDKAAKRWCDLADVALKVY
jgi:glycosyltransferase involved in cell wall biosynthesis